MDYGIMDYGVSHLTVPSIMGSDYGVSHLTGLIMELWGQSLDCPFGIMGSVT